MLHIFEKDAAHDEIILCAGLPLTGFRSLTRQEQTLLRHLKRRLLTKTIFWFAAIPVWLALPFVLWVGLSYLINDFELLDDIIFIFAIAAIALGIPFSLFFADIVLKRYRVVKSTLSVDSVRCFEGILNAEDWTDEAHDLLRRRGLISEDSSNPYRIELYAAYDVVYQVNRIKPKKWTAIKFTRAVPPPNSPARFIAPEDWQIRELYEERLSRRRLTENEREEILVYARRIRRRRWLLMFFTVWFLAALTRVPANLMDFDFHVSFTIWMTLAIPTCAILFLDGQ